jgi:hypothetical protein
MSSVVISGDTSGAITLSAPAVSGTNTITLPASTGTVMVNGPAFSAYQSTAQSLSTGVATKLLFQTTEFDTASKFTSSTTFTPNVAGYYQVNGCVELSSTNTTVYSAIYKNGSPYKLGSVGTAFSGANVSSIVYLNGTTDYIELYGYFGLTQNSQQGITATYFNACMVRSA